ncbi:ATP-binding protein [bacterium]
MKFPKQDLAIAKKMGRALKEYEMLEDGDVVAVGLSGGKDSYSLLDLLWRRKKYLPINYQIKALHVDFGYCGEQTQNIIKFCKERDIECYVQKEKLVIKKGRDVNCFYCSWVRRSILFKFLGKWNIKKLAFGHHMNDAAETLFLNMFYQSKFESFYPKTRFFKGEFDVIRPLILCTNKEIKEYADRNNLPYHAHSCPFDIESQRKKIRDIIDKFCIKDEQILYNIFASWMKSI